MADEGLTGEAAARRYAVLRPHLDERQRRLLLGAEAAELGRAGSRRSRRRPGCIRTRCAAGARELEDGRRRAVGRVRGAGGGRKTAPRPTRGWRPALTALVDPATRGDPMSPLVWTTKSTRNAGRGADRGRASGVGPDGGPDAARSRGSACRPTPRSPRAASTPTGTPSSATSTPQVRDHLAAGHPVISVDTKKKELVGEYKNGGREYQPAGHPSGSTCTTSPTRHWARPSRTASTTCRQHRLGRVGTDHDTSAFAVQPSPLVAHRRQRRYPDAGRLLICADGGGSNGYRVRAVEDRTRRVRRRNRPHDHRLPPTTLDQPDMTAAESKRGR